jgi:hypothetical protein
MSYKHNADRRRHIPTMPFKVRNWPADEPGLRRLDSLTLWIEGLMTSVLSLMGLTISAPDHTTVSRRRGDFAGHPGDVSAAWSATRIDPQHSLQVYGAGQWLVAKHDAKSRRKWRRLHLAVDAAGGMIVAQTLTDQDTDDPIGQVTADGAYDGAPTNQTIARMAMVSRWCSRLARRLSPAGKRVHLTQRDRHLAMIAEQGRLAWQIATDYGQRSLI